MRKTLIFICLCLGLCSYSSNAQVFLLKENFTSATGSLPPTGWKNEVIQGKILATWRFDNLGNRPLSLPFSTPFAIFDTRTVALNNVNQSAYLESPSMVAPQAGKLILSFDNLCEIDTGGVCKVQVLNENQWVDVKVFDKSSLQARNEVLEIATNIKPGNAFKVRFLWDGTQEGFWAIDNVNVFVPSSIDAGISALTSPVTPFGEGLNEIKVSLSNYGSSNLISSTIKWTIDGSPQPDYAWRGNLPLGSSFENIRIGTLNMKAGVNYALKVWSQSPNGVSDVNPSNDSIVRVLIPSLCGDYTIGGANPDFPTITRAVDFLNNAGVGCPVRFLIRDGVYNEQLEIVETKGASARNTVTFESESGDSSRVKITSRYDVSSYPYTIRLNSSRHIRFKNLTISKQGTFWSFWAFEIDGYSYDVDISNCLINPTEATGFYIKGMSDSIVVRNSLITGLKTILGNGIISETSGTTYVIDNTIKLLGRYGIEATKGSIVAWRNKIEQLPLAVYIDCPGNVELQGNLISQVKNGVQLKGQGRFNVTGNKISFGSGIGIETEARFLTLQNNWVYNGFVDGGSPVSGISVKSGRSVRLFNNAIHLNRTDSRSSALKIDGVDSLQILNNLFSVKQEGNPLMLNALPVFIRSDRNGYFSPNKNIGWLKGEIYREMDPWREVLKGDKDAVFCNPFYTSDSVLVPNQILLNNAALKIDGLLYDIDNKLRDTSKPDIGAIEFAPCSLDAGISLILTPSNPVAPGMQAVKVQLTNQGFETLNGVSIGWTVNNSTPVVVEWKGSLASGERTEVSLGTYEFKSVVEYGLKAWTISPNGKSDCNSRNDTSSVVGMYVKLCGTFTIGGTNPDFKTIGQAVSVLNNVGVSCPVTFRIRDGVYNEQLKIYNVPGTSSVNTVTFQSESLDSNSVTITSKYDSYIDPYTIYLNGARHIRFKHLNISKRGTPWDYWAVEVDGDSYDIEISHCYLNPFESAAVYVRGKSDSIVIRQNFLTGLYSSVGVGVRSVTSGTTYVIDNMITAFQFQGVVTYFGSIVVSGNKIRDVMNGIDLECTTRASVIGNDISRVKNGILLKSAAEYLVSANRVSFGSGVGIEARARNTIIQNNWIHNGYNDGGTSISGISVKSSSNIQLYFNSVHLVRNGFSTSALTVDAVDRIKIVNNIFSLKKEGYPVSLKKISGDFILDRNAYYSPSRFLGSLNDIAYKDLNSWSQIVKGEKGGMFCNPFFTNDSLPTPNHFLLNNVGTGIAGILKDLDSKVRDTLNPDIGAIEFTLCATDAGVSFMLSPENPIVPGVQEVKVLLTNQGLDSLTTASIGWSVNNGAVAFIDWKGMLASGKSVEITLGTFDFKPGVEYGLKAWSNKPNGKTDCNHQNDTSANTGLYVKLCGTFTIGGSNPDFKTIGQAVSVLNTVGVGCPVTFRIRDGVYNEQLRLDSIPGSSLTNTVTFESESRDSTKVKITSRYDVSFYQYTWLLNGTRHLRFKHLSLSKLGTYWDYWALELNGACYNIEVSNCQLNPTDAYAMHILGQSDSIVIRNNFIKGLNSNLGHGIRMNTSGFVRITNNVITTFPWATILGEVGKADISMNNISLTPLAIDINSPKAATIIGNELLQVKDGMNLVGVGVFKVSENKINFGKGTGLSASINNSVISNNWLRNTDSVSTNGMLFRNGRNNRILYNSVNISGKNNNSSSISMEDVQGMTLLNNVFRNMAGGYCFRVKGQLNGFKSDNNNYFAPLGNVALHNGVGYTYLKDWGTVIKGETNSIFCNPFFANDSSYKPNHILLDKAGIPIDLFRHDIDSVLRDAESPDIGVKEFVPCDNDAGVNEFTYPRVSVSGGNQNVKVVLQNQGFKDIRNVIIHWSVNGISQIPMTWSGTLTYKKNIEVDLGEYRFVNGLEYTLKAWTVGPNGDKDCNAFNDTSYIVIPGIKPSPDALWVQIESTESDCGSTVDVPVKAYPLSDLSSLTFSMNWDTSKLKFAQVILPTSSPLGITNSNFVTSQSSNGSLVFSWKPSYDTSKFRVDTAVLFNLRFTTYTGGQTASQILFTNSPDSIKSFYANGKPRAVVASDGNVKIMCTLTVSGRVYSPSNIPLQNTNVFIESADSITQVFTNKEGYYSKNMVYKYSRISPLVKKEVSTKNGITTLDIALIQSHILMKTKLNAPFGIIAADADRNSNITTHDILFLRRIILDYDTSFPGNRTWVFVDSMHKFVNPTRPFPYPSHIDVVTRPVGVPFSFVGIKMGDVNADRNPMLDQAPSGDTLSMYGEWTEASDGILHFNLKARSVSSLMGYQTGLEWDAGNLIFEGVAANPTGISIGEKWSDDGHLSLSWNDPQASGLTFMEGMTILDLRFRRKNAAVPASLKFSPKRIPIEAFNARFQSMGLKLDTSELRGPSWNGMIRVYPNPAYRLVNVEWKSTRNGSGLIRLVDAQGRVVYQREAAVVQGLNKARIDVPVGMASGSFVVQLLMGADVITATVLIGK